MRIITTKGLENLIALLKESLESEKDDVTIARSPGHSSGHANSISTNAFQFTELKINGVTEVTIALTFPRYIPDIIMNLLPGQIMMNLYITLSSHELLSKFDLVQLENNDLEVKKLANLVIHTLSKAVAENIQKEVDNYQLQVNYLENLSRLLGNISSIEEE